MFTIRKFPFRMVLYGIVLIYLISDLFIFNGPLRHKFDLGNPKSEVAISHAISMGAVARVGGRIISSSQLERSVTERLWRIGKTTADITLTELKTVRQAALESLIDQEILRLEIERSAEEIPVSEDEINERLRRLIGRFESKGTLESAMKSQGISNEDSLRKRLSAQIRHEKFLAAKIKPSAKILTQEAEDWFEQNRDSLALPERIEARHIFIPTLNQPEDEAEATLLEVLDKLTQKIQDFPTLANEFSQDPATKNSGGSLGWMTRDRLPPDFAANVFSLDLNQPTLVRSHLGWHLVEVTARKSSEPRNFAEAEREIIAAMEAVKRNAAISEYRNTLRTFHAADVEIFKTGTP